MKTADQTDSALLKEANSSATAGDTQFKGFIGKSSPGRQRPGWSRGKAIEQDTAKSRAQRFLGHWMQAGVFLHKNTYLKRGCLAKRRSKTVSDWPYPTKRYLCLYIWKGKHLEFTFYNASLNTKIGEELVLIIFLLLLFTFKVKNFRFNKIQTLRKWNCLFTVQKK